MLLRAPHKRSFYIIIISIICCSLPAWGARQLSKFLGIKFEITGHENIVQDSGCVVLMNHQSALDVLGEFLVCSLLGCDCYMTISYNNGLCVRSRKRCVNLNEPCPKKVWVISLLLTLQIKTHSHMHTHTKLNKKLRECLIVKQYLIFIHYGDTTSD
jgi:hypothetical protein